MDAFFGAVNLLPYDRAAAQATSQFRAVLELSGRPIGAYDTLIAISDLSHSTGR
jgi:predicted nucleic acid-binding protein